MIEEIDIHNASSTIGTLEFLDQISKFASVNNLCYTKETLDMESPDNAENPYLEIDKYKSYKNNITHVYKTK